MSFKAMYTDTWKCTNLLLLLYLSHVRNSIFPVPDRRKLHLPSKNLHKLSILSLGNTKIHYIMLFPVKVEVSYCTGVVYISGGKTVLLELVTPCHLCQFRQPSSIQHLVCFFRSPTAELQPQLLTECLTGKQQDREDCICLKRIQ